MRALAVAALIAVPAAAHADAYEASLDVASTGGLARLGDPSMNVDGTATQAGLRLRFSAATSHWWQYEASAGFGMLVGYRSDTFDNQGFDTEITREGGYVADGAAGVTGRFGVRFIPTANLSAGVMHWSMPAGSAVDPRSGDEAMAVDGASRTDLHLRASLGFDYRLGARWIVGGRLGVQHALGLADTSFDAATVSLAVSYYWYPRWFSLGG